MKNATSLDLELRIAKLLRYGVLVSGAFMLAGWLSQIRGGGNPFLEFHDYHAMRFWDVIQSLWRDANYGLLISYFGLLVLISLPVLRVFFTAVLFFRQNDKLLGSIASVVLLILIASFLLGFEL